MDGQDRQDGEAVRADLPPGPLPSGKGLTVAVGIASLGGYSGRWERAERVVEAGNGIGYCHW